MDKRQEILVENNLPLIWAVIRKNHFVALDSAMNNEDLFQIGAIGLVKAAKNYRCDTDVLFAPYAYHAIWNEIAMDMRRKKTKSRSGMLDTLSLEQPVTFSGKAAIADMVPDSGARPDDFLRETPARDYVEKLREQNPVLCDVFVRKIKQEQAAELLGCSQPHVSRLVQAERRHLLKLIACK